MELFASVKNTVLPTFCMRFRQPQVWGTGALRLDSTGMFANTHPLILLLSKVEQEPCNIILIASTKLVPMTGVTPGSHPPPSNQGPPAVLVPAGGVHFSQPENLYLTAWMFLRKSEEADALAAASRRDRTIKVYDSRIRH